MIESAGSEHVNPIGISWIKKHKPMPILTCPFNAIAARNLEPGTVQYPQNVKITTELSIKPTATETWDVEGLSLQFTAKYSSAYYVNIKVDKKRLEKQRANLEASLVNANEAVQNRKEIYEEGPTKEKYIEFLNAAMTKHSIEGEIEAINRELENLGRQTSKEGLKSPTLLISTKLYARGNELVWNESLTPLRFLTPSKYRQEVTYAVAEGTWNENINDHTQFDDPIGFTERENLLLVLEFSAPPKIPETEGGFEGPEVNGVIELSPIQAIVNYSRTVAGEKE